MAELRTSFENAWKNIQEGRVLPPRASSSAHVAEMATDKLASFNSLHNQPEVQAGLSAIERSNQIEYADGDNRTISEKFFEGFTGEQLYSIGTMKMLEAEVGKPTAVELAKLVEQRRQNDALEAIAVALSARAEAERNRTKLENDRFER